MPQSSGGKRSGISGVIQCIEHQWYVQYTDPLRGTPKTLPVSDEDAWNFDVEHNLPVIFQLVDTRARLVSRKGNKRFVTVTKS